VAYAGEIEGLSNDASLNDDAAGAATEWSDAVDDDDEDEGFSVCLMSDASRKLPVNCTHGL